MRVPDGGCVDRLVITERWVGTGELVECEPVALMEQTEGGWWGTACWQCSPATRRRTCPRWPSPNRGCGAAARWHAGPGGWVGRFLRAAAAVACIEETVLPACGRWSPGSELPFPSWVLDVVVGFPVVSSTKQVEVVKVGGATAQNKSGLGTSRSACRRPESAGRATSRMRCGRDAPPCGLCQQSCLSLPDTGEQEEQVDQLLLQFPIGEGRRGCVIGPAGRGPG